MTTTRTVRGPAEDAVRCERRPDEITRRLLSGIANSIKSPPFGPRACHAAG